MSKFTDFLTFEYVNAYANAYDLSIKKKYTEPKIHDCNGDLTKRWYVYYSYRNPKTNKLERQTPIYGGANRYKRKSERLEILRMYAISLHDYLKQGFDPYVNNEFRISTKPSEKRVTINEAIDKVLLIKKKVLKDTSYSNFKSRIHMFESWFKKRHGDVSVREVTKKNIIDYLNEVLERTSARTRNNTRTDLSSLFQAFEDNELVTSNFVKNINVLKSTPERNKTYTPKQQEEIFDYLKIHDPILLLFIKFISYNLLRPIEVCRLKIKDIDVADKKVYVRAKNSPIKIKIIPDIMLNDLPNLKELNPNDFLFTPNKIGGFWDATEVNRRDYFTKRFKKVVKVHFDLGKDYGLYSFRHTFITKLYRELAKTATPFEVKSHLMLITGHTTMTALEKYLRDIDAILPKDYSDLIS